MAWLKKPMDDEDEFYISLLCFCGAFILLPIFAILI